MSTKMATFEELHDFANKVRAAGGGNPIEALLPAIPKNDKQCLIAKNLNFNCKVNAYAISQDQFNYNLTIERNIRKYTWCMLLDNRELRDEISKKLKLKKVNKIWRDPICTHVCGVILPKKFALLAQAFDDCLSLVARHYDYDKECWVYNIKEGKRDRKRLEMMLPYIESARLEFYRYNSIINERGQLLI